MSNLQEAAQGLSTDDWHELLVARIDNSDVTVDDFPLPGFPDEQIQLNLNGRPAAASMPAARGLFEWSRQFFASVPPGQYLDFGSGWGRIWRYFLYDFPIEDMRAFDVAPKLTSFWESSMIGAELDVGVAGEPLPYSDGQFSAVTSNSVFSHLSEDLNLTTAKELRRVMKTGGVICLTTFGRRHLERWADLASGDLADLNDRQRSLASMSDDFANCIKRFEAGEFVFLEVGHDRRSSHLKDYEIAAVSPVWFQENWGRWFEVIGQSVTATPQQAIALRAI